jgi:ribosomal protein S14
MAQIKSSASAQPPTRESRRCEVCGVSSHEKTLVGLKNDRRRNGSRFCLPHHPESLAGSVLSVALVGALR